VCGDTPNLYGLCNMFNNVWELTSDCVHLDYKKAPSNGEAWITGGDCSERMMRGGVTMLAPWAIAFKRTPVRFWSAVRDRSDNVGLRVVRELP